ELPGDPRPVRGQHPGRWPGLLNPGRRRHHRHGRAQRGAATDTCRRRPGSRGCGGADRMAGLTLNEGQRRLLKSILERGAEGASQALSKWLDRPVRLEVGEVEQVEIEAATEAMGPGDALVAACAMPVSGRLTGQLILVFEDEAGLALADLLQRQPI